MYKISNKDEFECLISVGEIPDIIANQVYGDLLMFGELMNEEHLDEDKSLIIIINKEDFKYLKNEIKFDLDMYEYKDVVGVNDEYYIEKLLYIKNNGNTGLIIYRVNNFGKTKEKFDNDVYITKGIRAKFKDDFIYLLKSMVEDSRDSLKGKLDYLQIFNVVKIGENVIRIEHKQEVPNHSKVYYIEGHNYEDSKIYWISDEYEGNEYSTILLAEEY